jgi:hypothetical protein
VQAVLPSSEDRATPGLPSDMVLGALFMPPVVSYKSPIRLELQDFSRYLVFKQIKIKLGIFVNSICFAYLNFNKIKVGGVVLK